jgi:hypothetical protein
MHSDSRPHAACARRECGRAGGHMYVCKRLEQEEPMLHFLRVFRVFTGRGGDILIVPKLEKHHPFHC